MVDYKRGYSISTGMPRDCDPDDVIRLDPDNIFSDRFTLSPSGQLILAHRFWYFQPAHYCIDDFFIEHNGQATRSGFICLSGIEQFPASAIDFQGKLDLGFLMKEDIPTNDTLEWRDKTVLRKCCDQQEVYLAQEGYCSADSQGLSTEYMNDLKDNESLFLRIGNIDCADMELTPEGTNFTLLPNGNILMDDYDAFTVQLHSDFYCMDEFLSYDEYNEPEITDRAWYCASQAETARRASADERRLQLRLPKCCKAGELYVDDECQPYDYSNRVGVSGGLDYTLLQAVRNRFQDEEADVALDIDFYLSEPLGCEAKQVYLNDLTNDSFMVPLFQSNNATTATATAKIQYLWTCPTSLWKMNVSVPNFCVENEQDLVGNQTVYNQIVRYCPARSYVSVHYPVLLWTSSLALLATFTIYFYVPAQGCYLIHLIRSHHPK